MPFSLNDLQDNDWIFIAATSLGTLVLAITAVATYRLQRRLAARHKSETPSKDRRTPSNIVGVHAGEDVNIGGSAKVNITSVQHRDT
ncbi:MAG: hypothetical protein GVY33_17115 [Alphaproteobacteria bacterium]|jgi:hypothetical protein|nr:hypothetical protein [Alphaproteobacteria bacterium]